MEAWTHRGGFTVAGLAATSLFAACTLAFPADELSTGTLVLATHDAGLGDGATTTATASGAAGGGGGGGFGTGGTAGNGGAGGSCECVAGATQSVVCGNCGTKARTCSDACAWSDYTACTGEGVCAAKSTEAGGCDPCEEKTCTDACVWSACALKPGSACAYETGSNLKCCGTGHMWQFCSSECQWDPCAVETTPPYVCPP